MNRFPCLLALFIMSSAAYTQVLPNDGTWYAVNDSVMGGISQGGVSRTDDSILRFAGILSLENNGGFSSIRSDSPGYASPPGKDLLLTVRGDGREYYFDLRSNLRQRAFSYRQAFSTTAGKVEEIRLPMTGFYASSFGRRLPLAIPLDPADIQSIGITLSDKKAGPFRLDILKIEWVDAALAESFTVEDYLRAAISRGVPLYNRGDANACADVYETALGALLLLPEDRLTEPSRKTVRSVLAAAAVQVSADEKAWTLRRGIDDLLK